MKKLHWIEGLFCRLRGTALAFLMVGTASAAFATKTYSDNADGTVTDPITGLQWMRCSLGQTWDGYTCNGTAGTYSWDQANALTGTVTFVGQGDWRLPNVRELQSIVDRSRINPATDPLAFPNAPASYFWSTTPVLGGGAWGVSVAYGYAYVFAKGFAYPVRLVRAGQPLDPLLTLARSNSDYVDNGSSGRTVTHTATGLEWQLCPKGQTLGIVDLFRGLECIGSAATYTWAAAMAMTDNYAGETDWRLPTEDELLSLVDYTRANPALNTSIFRANLASTFWSASTSAGGSSSAWFVNFDMGGADTANKGSSSEVRLVRAGNPYTPVILTVGKIGAGTVSSSALGGIDCGSTCTGSYTPGTTVILTATPAANLISWGGICSGSAPTCTVTMTNAKTATASFGNAPPSTGTLIIRYRLYSDYTHEHLYTSDTNEYSALPVCCGWKAEGPLYKVFQAAGSFSGVDAVAYYRLYNPNSYQHHWTTDAHEYGVLTTMGWKQEGIDGYILPNAATGSIPLYRLYLNAFGGLHLWTTDANERNVLTNSGNWNDEGVAGYVVPLP